LPFDILWTLFASGLLVLAYALSGTIAFDKVSRAKYVSEFLGTFMLVLSVGCNVVVGDKTWGVTSIACTLVVMIYALGSVSGANFNPAVSVALGLSQRLAWKDVCTYVCIQLSAGIFAADFYSYMLGHAFNLAPSPGYNLLQAGVAELLYTFMLTFVVLNVCASKAHSGKNQFFGIAIGFTVIAGGYGAGAISGGCFNPAIALGINAASFQSFIGFGTCLAYIVFEFIGCAMASFCFRIVRPEDYADAGRPGPCEKMVSELLGTYMLVLTVGLNVLSKSPAAVFSIAASLTCMVFALGSVSGAHFNPAVTLAIFCSARELITVREAIQYVFSQICGAFLAGLTFMFLMNGQTVSLKPGDTAVRYQAILGEFFFTFLLCFVVLCVATVKKPLTEYFGLAIGACVISGGLAIGSLSGGSLNPAVSAGLAISDKLNGGSISYLFSYWTAELVGGIMASAIFMITHVQSEFARPEFVKTTG
jgi:aquaporin Z